MHTPPEHDHESVYEVPPTPGAPVDPLAARTPVFAAVITDQRDRRPIVPAALRSRDNRRALGRWAVGYTGHTLAYHLTRSPKYLVKTLMWAPVGAGRCVGKAMRWGFDLESFGLRQDAASRNDAATYLALSRQRDKRVGWRGLVLTAGGVLALIGLVLLLWLGPLWVQLAAAGVAVPVLARLGRPIDKPILDRVTAPTAYRKLTAEMVRQALVATGTVKDPALLTFAREIHRDGPGYLAVVDLPDGVIATDVIDKRDRLAGSRSLRLPVDQVWPETMRGEHPGRLALWVADKPVSAMRPPPWPLLASGQVDYFKPFPYGHDVRQRPVMWRLDERNSLFGGVPGSGKSLAVRTVLLAAILDPLVIPAVAELKGSGDFDAVAPLCPKGRYASGADEGTKHQAMAILEWLLDECEKRPPLIKRYAEQGLNSENKVNRAMAEKDHRVRPIVAVFDEVQELFTDPELGKPAVAIATSIVKRGRSQGIHLILATQRIDAPSVPKAISSNVVLRLALAVTSHIETDLILGTGAYRNGARPTQFEPEVDAGWGYRVGMGPMSAVRAAYLNNEHAKAIAARAIAMRTGEVGDESSREPVFAHNLLHDVRRVWIVGEPALWSELIVPRLQQLKPDIYGDLTVEVFGAMMAGAGVPTVKLGRRIDGKPHTRAGVKLAELETAIKAREIKNS